MKCTKELFGNRNGCNTFHDTVLDATGESKSTTQLKATFRSLPEEIRNIAHQWGLSDTVFRDQAHEELRKRKKAV